jgi:thioredoxin 1
VGVIQVTDNTFEDIVIESANPVLVDFWATWCKSCKMVAPILEELSREYDGKLTIAQIDVEPNQQTRQKYHIISMPFMIVFKKGQPAGSIVGFKPKADLKRELDSILGQ